MGTDSHHANVPCGLPTRCESSSTHLRYGTCGMTPPEPNLVHLSLLGYTQEDGSGVIYSISDPPSSYITDKHYPSMDDDFP